MRACVLLTLPALLSLAFAPAPFVRPARKAPAPAIQGRWAQVGRPSVTLVVTATTLEYHNQGWRVVVYDLTCNPRATPMTHELRGREKHGSFHGIYKIENDVLTLVDRNMVQPRPTSFNEQAVTTEVFKRLK